MTNNIRYEQFKIRWDHSLLGRFSKQWKSMHYQTLIERDITDEEEFRDMIDQAELRTVIWNRIYQV